MPFELGTFCLTVFNFTEEFPNNFLELFTAKCAGKLDDVKDEPQMGWVSGRHLLERRIDEETSIVGSGYVYLHLRIAQRKIPSALLKAECKMEELAYCKATGNHDVPRKVKREIKSNIEKKRFPQMVPQLSGVPLVIDQSQKTLYLGTTSQKQIDLFVGYFFETTNIKLFQLSVDTLFFENKKDIHSYHGMQLSKYLDEGIFPCRDFLTWLWYHSEEEKGNVKLADYGVFATAVDGPLFFNAEGKGAFESVVRKGNPLRSAEAQVALKMGKKLKKSKIIFAKEKQVWSASFDADKLSFSSMNLPEGEDMEYTERFTERMETLYIFILLFKELFSIYLNETEKNTWKDKSKKISVWVEGWESY